MYILLPLWPLRQWEIEGHRAKQNDAGSASSRAGPPGAGRVSFCALAKDIWRYEFGTSLLGDEAFGWW
jgi:hypothetical protein